MSTSETPARDAKLAQYVGEALGNEKRLETALQAHIGLTTRAPYKRRLRKHLTETRRHASSLTRRLKQLGGSSDPIPGPLARGPLADAAGAVVGGAQKASALARGPLHALRGTGEQERQLKNAKTEYAEEAQEIGMYTALEALAATLGDKDTARLAREILRDERRMLAFLEREIPRLSAAVARAEVPAAQRNGATGRPRRAPKRGRASTPNSARRNGHAPRGAARRSGGARRGASSQRSRSRTRAAGATAS